jgi:hypothetical protein
MRARVATGDAAAGRTATGSRSGATRRHRCSTRGRGCEPLRDVVPVASVAAERADGGQAAYGLFADTAAQPRRRLLRAPALLLLLLLCRVLTRGVRGCLLGVW